MNFDEHGLPRPERFQAERPARSRITAGRIVALVAVIVGSVGAAFAVQYAPELEKLLDGNAQQAAKKVLLEALEKADLAERRGDWTAALAAYERVAQLAPRWVGSHVARSTVLARMERYTDAIAACDDGLALAPGLPLLLNNRAYFRSMARVDVPAALADIEQALQEGPNAGYLDTRAYIHYLLGNFDRAAADYETALRLIRSGEHGRESEQSLGEILFHRGLLRKARGDAQGMTADFAAARRRGFRISAEPPPLVPPKLKTAPAATPAPDAEPMRT